MVVDAPEHLQVLPVDEALVVPLGVAERLAEVLDLDRSSEVVRAPDLSRREQPAGAGRGGGARRPACQ